MEIDLSDYVAGGYFIIKTIDKGFAPSDLLPERVISLSNCIGKRLEIHWAFDTQLYEGDALRFGIRQDKLDAFSEWGSRPPVINDFPYGMRHVDALLYAAHELFTPQAEIMVVGMAMHRELVDDFLTYKPYPDVHPNYVVYTRPGTDQHSKTYLENHPVNERKPLEPGGIPLGFEVISYFFGMLSHSWLCEGLEVEMNKLFNIRPNEYGLINSYEEAKEVYEWIAEDKLQGSRAEPEPHFPWLLVQYLLS